MQVNLLKKELVFAIDELEDAFVNWITTLLLVDNRKHYVDHAFCFDFVDFEVRGDFEFFDSEVRGDLVAFFLLRRGESDDLLVAINADLGS